VIYFLSLICGLTLPLIVGQATKTGTYKVLIDGKSAGVERFEIVSAPGSHTIKSTAEMQVRGGVQKIITSTQVRNQRMTRYTLEISEGAKTQNYVFDFNRGTARIAIEIDGRKTERTRRLSESIIPLDKNVWHHYLLLVQNYDLAQGGRQRLRIFIPQAAFAEYVALVELKETISYNFGQVKKKANRFSIIIGEGFEVKLIADEGGQPLSIEIPSEDTKVLLEPLP
jgi:hypothetical protein